MSLWTELRRRNVFRVGAAYLVASWLIVQVADQVTGPLNLPESFATVVIVLLAIGFPIALIVAWIYEVTPEGVRVTPDSSGAVPQPRSAHRLNIVIVALLLAAVGLLAADTLVLERSDVAPGVVGADEVVAAERDAETDPNATADANAGAGKLLKLVVLPFDDDSQAGDQEYLADGFAGEIRTTLSLVEGLNVMGDATSPLLKEQLAEGRSLREEWGIDYVLSGSVLTSGDQLRIRVELTSTEDADIVYTNSYERMVEDSFVLLDEIAATVARAMEITLGVGEVGGRLGGTRNVAAFEEFLKANGLPPLNLANARASVSLLEHAVAIDEDFSLAWFALAMRSRSVDLFSQSQGGDAAALKRADEAMSRVIELTPGLPELLLADVWLPSPGSRPDIFEVGKRFDEFSRAAAESGYPPEEIAAAQSAFLYGVGRIRDAVALAERSRAADPLSLFPTLIVVEGYAAQGRSEESLALARSYAAEVGRFVVELAGRAPYTALESGDEEVIEAALAIWAQSERGPGGLIHRMGQLRNDPEQALADLEATYRSGELGPAGALHAALWAAYFGDTELTLEILENGDLQSIVLNVPRPLFSQIRQTEAFRNLLRARGFEAYWRESGTWPDYCRPLGLNDFECF